MKRRTFIKSAALLSIASAVPAYSNTPQVCSALTNNIDTTKGEAVALISDLHIDDDPLIAEFTTALQNIKRRGINNIIIPGDIAEDIPFIRKTYAAISQHFNGKEALLNKSESADRMAPAGPLVMRSELCPAYPTMSSGLAL